MNKFSLLALTLLAYAVPCLAVPGAEFAIKKVDLDYPLSPDYAVNQGLNIRWTPQKWAKMEVTFEAVPDNTDELVFNYYVLLANRLFVGHVTHVNIVKGHDLHSVMYISPKTLLRIMQRPTPIPNWPFEQVTVTITKPGVAAPLAMGNYKGQGRVDWWSTLKQEEGFLLNKSETPFAPLYWDYYEAVKPAAVR